MRAPSESRPCKRCGRKRLVRSNRGSALCKDCVSFRFTDPEPLAGGRWVREGLTWRWQEHWIEWAEQDAIKASWRRKEAA